MEETLAVTYIGLVLVTDLPQDRWNLEKQQQLFFSGNLCPVI